MDVNLIFLNIATAYALAMCAGILAGIFWAILFYWTRI